MRIVAGIDIDRVFTGEEIIDLYHKGKLKPIALEGYCTRADADGTIRFIPWYESTRFRYENDSRVSVTPDGDAMREEVERENPIIRRTPQQRVAAMAMRIMGEVQRSGNAGGLSAEQVRSIVGESFREGEPITGSDVEALAAHFLGKAEKHNREADSKRVTRAHPTA